MPKILAIDPGLNATGVVFLSHGSLLAHTTIRTTPKHPPTARFRKLKNDLTTFIKTTKKTPELITIEYPLFPMTRLNWRGVSLLHQSVGSIITTISDTFPQTPVLFVIPTRGKTRPATKTKVKGLSSHEADALCLAQYVSQAITTTNKAINQRWREAVVCFSRGKVEVKNAWR